MKLKKYSRWRIESELKRINSVMWSIVGFVLIILAIIAEKDILFIMSIL